LPQKVVTIKKYRPKNAALALIFADFLDNPPKMHPNWTDFLETP
jgi:hypothetical protein